MEGRDERARDWAGLTDLVQVIAAALAMVDGKILAALNVPLDTEVEVSIVTVLVFYSGLYLSFYILGRASHAQ